MSTVIHLDLGGLSRPEIRGELLNGQHFRWLDSTLGLVQYTMCSNK